MKFKKIVLPLLACLSLAGCDFNLFPDESGGRADVTLYELKLTSNLEKAKSSLSANLSRERDQDEIDDLLADGATQSDINKSNTCINGTYYYFDQDPIYLSEPFLPGYEFLGWYNGNTFLGFLDTDYDGTPEYKWNMENKNVTLEARYKLVTYNILYMDSGTSVVSAGSNPSSWNVEQGEITLTHTDKTSEGLQFDGWTFVMGGASHYDGYVTKLNEQFLIDSGVAKESSNGSGSMTFSLHENYSVIIHQVKLTFDNTIIDNIRLELQEPGGINTNFDPDGVHFVTSGEVNASIKHGSIVTVFPHIDNFEYEIGGIYYGNTKISTGNDATGYKITVTMDATVELRYKAK